MAATLVQKGFNVILKRTEATPLLRPGLVRVDEVSFEAFFRRYYPLALNYLYRRLRNRELADEITESAFVRLVSDAGKVEVSDCTAWVYRVVINELQSYLRLQRNRNRFHKRFREWRRARLVRATPPPGEALDFPSVSAAISRLDDKLSAVLSLRYFERLEVSEIARILRTRESTVRARLRRGLKELRAQLGVRPPSTGQSGETR
jgi:RNA polymerase sigma-70 factor (ECF subfamily)